MVLTGRTNDKYPISPGSLGKKKHTYGTNLPGPTIAYETTTQDGNPQNAIGAQLPQSAHFSLNLPFITFGLGRTSNFIQKLEVGVSVIFYNIQLLIFYFCIESQKNEYIYNDKLKLDLLT